MLIGFRLLRVFLIFCSLLQLKTSGQISLVLDPQLTQTVKFTLYSSLTPLTQTTTLIYRCTYSTQFKYQPSIFLGILGFDMQNSTHVQFKLIDNRILSRSYSQYTLQVGQTTRIKYFRANAFIFTQPMATIYDFTFGIDNPANLCNYNCQIHNGSNTYFSITGLEYSFDYNQPGQKLQITFNPRSGNVTYGLAVNLTKIHFNTYNMGLPIGTKLEDFVLYPGFYTYGLKTFEIVRKQIIFSHSKLVTQFMYSLRDSGKINYTSKFPDELFVGVLGFQLQTNEYLSFNISAELSRQNLALYLSQPGGEGGEGREGGEQAVVFGNVDIQLFELYFAFCDNPSDFIKKNSQYEFECQICSVECATCINTLCGSCLDVTRVLEITNIHTGGGICVCPALTFLNQQSQCQNCDTGCLLCQGASWNCSMCFPGYMLAGSRCMFLCFVTSSLQALTTCQICPDGCSVCSSSKKCNHTLCQNSSYLYFNGTCYEICPDGLYATRGICMKCKDQCATCSNLTVCLSCITGYYLSGLDCKICHGLCKTCHGPLVTDCDTCKYGELSSGEGEGGCSSQTIPDSNSSEIYFDAVQCAKGYYYFKENKQCRACSQGCTQCPDSTFCYHCEKEYILTGDRCEKCELVSGYTYSYALERCVEICGDKMRLYAKCDDGNGISGDGCSSQCVIEDGYICQPSSNGDFCFQKQNQLKITLNKSIIANSLKIQIKSASGIFKRLPGPPDLNCLSVKSVPSQVNISKSDTRKDLIYDIDFVESVESHRCSLNVGVGLVVNFQIATSPRSYLNPIELANTIQTFSSVVQGLSYLGIFLAFFNHLLNFKSTSSFIEHLCLYAACMVQMKYIPSYLYRITFGLKHLMVIMTADYLQDFYSLNYVFGVNNNIGLSMRGIIIYMSIIAAFALTFWFLRRFDKLNSHMCQLFKSVIKDNFLFEYETYTMYEPMILVYLVLSPKDNLSTADYVTYFFVTSYFVFTIFAFFKLTVFAPYKLIKSNHLIRRIRSCFFGLGVAFTQIGTDLGQLPTIVAFLLTTSLFISDVHSVTLNNCKKAQLIQSHGLIWRRTDSVQSDLSTTSQAKLKSLNRIFSKFQQISNSLFFMIQCLNILVVYYSSGAEQTLNHSGLVSAYNLIFFLTINIMCMVFLFAFKIKKVFRSDVRAEVEPEPEPQNNESHQIDASTQNMSLGFSRHKSINLGDPTEILGQNRNPEEQPQIMIKKNKQIKESIRQLVELEDRHEGSHSLSEHDIIII